MKHFGDITKIHGADVPPVDAVIGGSPCQGLSIAGRRAGLADERSGLFMEQIRVIKEMRRSHGKPRWMVWENVPGAFSSNKGEDFGAVLHETIRIVCPKAPPVSVPQNGWPTSGCIVGDEWSLAWRVLDAQFWGVPQRRRRIALVTDFAGQSAPEILFEREIVSGDSEPGEAPREGTPGAAAAGTYPAIARSITARYDGSPCIDRGPNIVFCLQGNGIDRAETAGCNGRGWKEDVSYTLNTIDRPAVCAAFKLGNGERARSIGYAEEQSPTLNAECGGNKPAILDMTHTDAAPLTYRQNGFGDYKESDTASSCKQRDFKDATDLCTQYGIVRRLTPLECERLQGFPDGWTDIGAWTDTKGQVHKESSDSARYRALGNSIAIPPWTYVLRRLSLFTGSAHPTMASLFDGIGGFPLIWQRLNGEGTCLWASEIEEFPIAVTKYHFSRKGE